jgi:hypothetical protein
VDPLTGWVNEALCDNLEYAYSEMPELIIYVGAVELLPCNTPCLIWDVSLLL